jgi:hypothetical protein
MIAIVSVTERSSIRVHFIPLLGDVTIHKGVVVDLVMTSERTKWRRRAVVVGDKVQFATCAFLVGASSR